MDLPRILVVDDDPVVLRWFDGVLHATCVVVTGPTGVLLIARGQRVTEHLRHKIRMHWCSLAAQLDVRMILPAVNAVEDTCLATAAA
ncbi:MAG: hypothetical protein H7066_20515 [Cytophagaceae bacterium]|nr:hypothetical protein [Gemmatimonadaceae bacterium]